MFRLLPRKTTLRMRVMLCCAALGGAIGVCLAFVADVISEHDEYLLINEEMQAELSVQIAQHGGDANDARLPRSPWKSVYIDRPGQPPTSPAWTRKMPAGIHELDKSVDGAGDGFVGIRQSAAGRVTMVAGLPDSPERERRFTEELIAMIVLGIVLGAWLGRMLAGGMLAPVLRLSHEVDRADPAAELLGIAEDHRSDEVGALAKAFIRYHGRVQAAIEREVLFSADASHELRTPLTVLQGALDLLDAQTVAAPARRRIDRIRRGAAEIGLLLDALLLIARSDEAQDPVTGTIDIGATLASTIAEYREELEAAQVAIGMRCTPGAVVQAPPELLRTALRLLFRAIPGGAWGNELRLDADAQGIALSSGDAPAAASPAEATAAPVVPRRSDESGGIGMLRRLCERYGWRLEDINESGRPVGLRIRMEAVGARPPAGAAT
ncbi:MAG TPA: histidine kinase dimerization/phospho-acceptor domain-containing protein [Xanthomonadaceae bacterium]